MKTNIIYKITFAFISSTLLFGCQPKNNFDIDLSNLPKPKTVKNINKENQISIKPEDKVFIKDLVSLENRAQILSKSKFGKKDPFSKSDIPFNKLLSSNFKVNGFLNTESEKYAFVKYLGIEGRISEKSIGGVNTNLLPEGAKVINIDTKNLVLTIDYENENLLFEL